MKYEACSAVNVQNPTDLSNNIALYPNPATEQITIENNNPTVITKLVFYNALGVSCASIQQSIGAGESVQVQLPQLSGGLYFVSLETAGQGRVLKRMVVAGK